MDIKSVLCIAVVLTALLLASPSDAHPKAILLKAKLAAIKAPHVAAHVAVATDVKLKTKDAFWKTVAAAKAAKLAALSIITAPFRVVGKKVALKFAAVKAAKALKVAKVAKAVAVLKSNPLIVPVPVPFKLPYPVLHKDAGAATIAALNPLGSVITGAQSILQIAGANPTLLPALGNAVASAVAASPVALLPALGNAVASAVEASQAASVPTADVATAEAETPIGFKFPISVPHQTYGVPNQYKQ